jgi:RNA polymerase sigma-70 factor (ECF subfamily)
MNYSHIKDEDLVKQYKFGDAVAFREIYDRYWNLLYKQATVTLGNNQEVEDILQTLFESLWKNKENITIRNLRAYLMASVKYLTIESIKLKINLRKYQEYVILQEIYNANQTDEIINVTELQQAVEKAMKALPEKTMEVFKLSRYENKSVKEIAHDLNLSEKAVEYHITKSLKLMKEQLYNIQNPN